MTENKPASIWSQWLHRPQRLWLRRALFQVHMWAGLSLGLYIFFISATGSVLVYRNELYAATISTPLVSDSTSALLDDQQLIDKALIEFPRHKVLRVSRADDPSQPVGVWLSYQGDTEHQLFDPRSGESLGSGITAGYHLVTILIKLHEDFLLGPTGRLVNGIGAVATVVLALTGLFMWWPGVSLWRQSLVVHRPAGLRRLSWDLHSAVGIWSFAFIFMFALSGVYLCFSESFHAFADWVAPVAAGDGGATAIDTILYWLAFLHFGRLNGIALPCTGPGLCDQSVKAVWALFGLAPAMMFVTGATMWWNRVLRRWWRHHRLK